MNFQNFKAYDPVSGEEIYELVFPTMDEGETSSTQTFRLKNVSAQTLTGLLLAVKAITGVFSGGSNEEGAEMRDEKWLQVKVGAGAWQGIGGSYATGASATNYYPIPDMASNDTVDIQVRVVIPSGISTTQVTRVRLGVAYPVQ